MPTPISWTALGASLLLLAPRAANAACWLGGARPTIPLPTMIGGQEFSFLASSDCEMLRFSVRGTTLEKIPRSGSPTGPGLHTYKVALTEDEWNAVVAESAATLTWIVSGRSSAGAITRLVTTNEISDDDGIVIDLSLADAKLLGEEPGDRAGLDAAAAGDVNGDGHDDLFVGALSNDAGGVDAGAAYLVLGPVTGTFDLSRSHAMLVGETADDWAAETVAGAGDVDADGHDDLLVGSRRHGDEGIAYLMLGPVSGTHDLSLADATLLGHLYGSETGYGVSGAGDTDGDGYDDVLVSTGLTRSTYDVPSHGFVYVVRGPVTGTFDLGFADALVEIDPGYNDGTHVAEAGDVDGDGLDDLLIGSPYDNEAAESAGAAYLVYGPVSGTSAMPLWDAKLLGGAEWETAGRDIAGGGDVDGDGNDDVVIGADFNDRGGEDAGAAFLVLGPVRGTRDLARAADATFLGQEHDGAGGMVSVAGDVDLDGRADLLIGAASDATSGFYTGAAYLVLSPVGGTMDLSSADVTFRGEARADYAGQRGEGAGDLDADGRADLLISAHGNDEGGVDAGAAYVFYGSGL